MIFSRRRLIIGGLWIALLGMILPASFLSVNPVKDVSLFNLAFANNNCEPDFTVTINTDGFNPMTVTVPIYTDTVVGGRFINIESGQLVTVTFPNGLFGPTYVVLPENGGSTTECEPDPEGGKNVITGSYGDGGFRMTVNIVREAVGGEILSNPYMLMLPALVFTLIMVSLIFTGGRIMKSQKIL
jgi:hypothetical protein